MKKSIRTLSAMICLLCLVPCVCLAARLGPARSADELSALAASAQPGDTLLISGDLDASACGVLSFPAGVTLKGEDDAVISGLSLSDSSVVLSGVSLTGGLNVTGRSHVQLTRGVSVSGGVDFSGSGTLLLDPGTSVEGKAGEPGVSVSHRGGDLYISLDGAVSGGAGATGGAAVVIDPLTTSGALMITGNLTGGAGGAFGGNALNLHNLSGNAYITVDGRLTGGSGDIGGSGVQLITAQDSVAAGIGGRISGGQGSSYGGDAMLLMNVGGSSQISLSGALIGGDASGVDSTPGQSLTLLGKTTALHTNVGDCVLEEGRQVLSSIKVTPLPQITASAGNMQPLPTPSPTPNPNEGMVATPGEALPEEPIPSPTPLPGEEGEEEDVLFSPGEAAPAD